MPSLDCVKVVLTVTHTLDLAASHLTEPDGFVFLHPITDATFERTPDAPRRDPGPHRDGQSAAASVFPSTAD